ncbi:vWA domain-containing protein [Flexivirga caeni]|uniref:VWA domain-containing protein n=1 Tax=Flexivirga caeni TaxID=2294115 RepID=A0A3M9MAV2_9MICO|nr:vWA domain-containing protein [Flexivirga caeni]RNI22297.1 VWA domain-containing protein [Flexivirga caeni]
MSPEVGELNADVLKEKLQDETDRTLELMAEMVHATDPVLREKAKRLAASLVVQLSRENRIGSSGASQLVPSRAVHDIDVDASLEAIVQARSEGIAPNLDDLVARSWTRPPLAVCLLIDASGSMRGARLAAASMIAAAVSLRAPQEHAVVSFSRAPQVIRALHEPAGPEQVVSRVLGLRGHGVTGLRGAFEAARDQLAHARARRTVVLLMSDCRSTDDQDPVPAALQLPNVRIVAPAEDFDEAEALAARIDARWVAPESIAELPAAIRLLMQ